MVSLVKGNYMIVVGYGYSSLAVDYTIYRLDSKGSIIYRVADIKSRKNAVTVLNVAIAQSW